MPRIPGVNHLSGPCEPPKRRAFVSPAKASIVMTDGGRILTVLRNNPVNAFTMRRIVQDAGLTEQEFRELL